MLQLIDKEGRILLRYKLVESYLSLLRIKKRTKIHMRIVKGQRTTKGPFFVTHFEVSAILGIGGRVGSRNGTGGGPSTYCSEALDVVHDGWR